MATLNQGLTLKTMLQEAAGRMGLPQPDSIVGNEEETAVRLLAIAHQSGYELVRRHPWQHLCTEKTFTTVAAETQTDTPLPTDFDRFIDGTVYNRSKKRELDGPLTKDEWNNLKSLTSQPVIDGFRIRGGLFLYYPAPEAGDTVAYEYVSRYWIATAAGNAGTLARFAADTNTILFDEEMFIQDVIWRYEKATGQNYAEDMRTAQLTILQQIGRDGGRRHDLRFAGGGRERKPGVVIPEGSWNQ
jgi:hypothetical protein